MCSSDLNGAKFFCLVYLSFLTREVDITAENLRKGDKVLGFDGKNYTEIEVTSSLRISPVTRKSEEIPKKIKMLFFETFDSLLMPRISLYLSRLYRKNSCRLYRSYPEVYPFHILPQSKVHRRVFWDFYQTPRLYRLISLIKVADRKSVV